MKIITTVQQLLFSKTTDLYALDTKIWKNILSSMKVKKDTWICRQIKYHQLRIKTETFISLEIILNVFNVRHYHFPLKSLFWFLRQIRLFDLASSLDLLCCQVCTFYCPLIRKRCTLLPERTDVHIWQHIHQKD